MKLKILMIALAGMVWGQQSVLSQTDASATNQAAGSQVVATNVPIGVAGTEALTATTNEASGSINTNAVASVDTNAVASDASATTAAGGDQSTNGVAAMAMAPASIPLIQFQDVPITTAIENLARQAGINYLLDPKIGYGQPDANGQIKVEPSLSIRWENITAEHALEALLDNYGLQLIEDRRSGISRITLKDPTAPPPLITRVVQLKYAGVSNIVNSVEATLVDKRSKVLADTRTSQMVVVATEPEQEAVDIMINQLDKPTRQVLIETKLVEISSNPSTSKGIDWSGTLAAQHFSFGNESVFITQPTPPTTTVGSGGATVTTPGSPGLVSGVLATPAVVASTANGFGTGFLNADGVSAVLSFLNQSSDAQVVSTPRVVTLDNETATISVTRGFPVINVTAGTANSTGGSTISYTNVGTVLQVTPRISANDFIFLKVVPDVSSFFGTVTKTIDGAVFQADEFDTRHIDTQVLIPNANTLVMGGLVKDNPNATYTKVPVLGDIPVLGYAFRSENKTLDKDNLLIFITPTIVKDSDYTPTTTDFLKSQPHTMKSPMNPNTWWDSSKPRGDWSNPVPTPGEFNRH
jgi:type II secretory pathway component GspD/PulD (secretin)